VIKYILGIARRWKNVLKAISVLVGILSLFINVRLYLASGDEWKLFDEFSDGATMLVSNISSKADDISKGKDVYANIEEVKHYSTTLKVKMDVYNEFMKKNRETKKFIIF